MVNCNPVANVTQSKYGICIYAIHGTNGYTTIIIHTMVIHVNTISIAANSLFLSPNCMGVNRALSTRFNTKGIHTKAGRFPLEVCMNTYPKDMKMTM